MKSKIILLLGLFLGVTGLSYSQRSFMAGEGIAVFYPAGFDSTLTLPSFIVERALTPQQAVPADWKIAPNFTQGDGSSVATISCGPDIDFYGTGEVTGPLRRNDTEIELWNTDNYVYGKAGGKRLYQSHPWVMGVRDDGSAFGIIADNSWRQFVSIKGSVTISSVGPPFRVIVVERASPQELMQALAELTGRMELPPLWALGYQQSKYSYFPDTRVKEIASEFRSRNIPCDVIWMDIDYMQDFKVFTFNEKSFPDPKGLNDYLHANNFRAVWMIDPGVKREEGYFVYDSGTAGDYWVNNSSGEPFTGKVWPGECLFPDFTMPETREWWGELYNNFITTGIDGVWNDMNEPSVFDGPDGTMPEDNMHRGGGEILPGPHLRYHNVYGMLMVKASRDGILKVNPDRRPFILSRSNFLGGQKYAATWTGDNTATWKHFKMATPMVLNLGLSGQPFSGPDLGGYKGSPDANLFANWIAVGAFYPFCRNHTEKGNAGHEPWVFGKKIEDVSRTALERRYRLLPYLYTLFHEASETGLPVMRPVFFADVTDRTLRGEEQAFMWGDDLLIIPRWAEDPHLPGGIWTKVSLLEKGVEDDGFQPELRQRGGSVIPLGRVIQSTQEYKTDSLTLLVCLDREGRATGTLYVDRGEGFGYRDGDYEVDTFSAARDGKESITVTCELSGISQTKEQRCYQVGMVTPAGIVYSAWQKGSVIRVKSRGGKR